jgi:K+-transporting ATPase ATPase C chain
MWTTLRASFVFLAIFSLLTGLLYPLVITGIAQAFFPRQANGSLITRHGKTAGSTLIGQHFDDPGYFWGRPSATSPVPYDAAASTGSNFGPLNPALLDSVKARVRALQSADAGNQELIPVDLVTSSGSGLDPHISVAAAEYQVPRVARVRHLSPGAVRPLVDRATDQRDLGFLGEARVSVLQLNIALDSITVLGGTTP